MNVINKAAGIVICDDAFLMVRKRGVGPVITLGGKLEADETAEQALQREAREEVGCGVRIIQKLGDFEAPAEAEDALLRMTVFIVELEGEPVPQKDDKIEEVVYVGSDYAERGIQLTEMIRQHVLPHMLEHRILNWS